jgi:hypothetical protein
MELTKIKRKLARVKMEHDFLRKAVTYFKKEQQSGRDIVNSCVWDFFQRILVLHN